MSKISPKRRAAAATERDTPRARAKAFLEGIAITGNIGKAAELAGIHRTTHYRWLQMSKKYAAAFAKAEDEFADRVRDMVRRRAIDGVPEPIIWKGRIVRDKKTKEIVTVLKRSDRILEMLAKGKCPEFRDKQEVEHSGDVSFRWLTPDEKPQ
jgi:hypothetical protein